MAYYCPNAWSYEGKPLIENGECAVLVERLSHVGRAATWLQGKRVRNNLTIRPGTAIATFDVMGRYPNHPAKALAVFDPEGGRPRVLRGNHAALYLDQDEIGIWVIEQYVGLEEIQKRRIRFMNGAAPHNNNVSNDADAYSVIE